MNQSSQPNHDVFQNTIQLQSRLEEAEAQSNLGGMFPRIERLYRVIMDNLLEGALIILGDGKIIYCNQNFADMVESRIPEMVGYKIFDLISLPDREPFRFAFSQAQRERKKCEVQLQLKNGGSLPVLFTMAAGYETGNTIGATVVNLTEQKGREREAKLAHERLMKKEKMEALGTLAGGIAHDLNNALSPIMMNTDLILLDLPPENPFRSALQTVRTAALRAKKLVEQILNFGSHRRMTEKRPVDVASIIEECLVLIKAGVPANIEIQQDILNESAFVLANSTQIHQIVMNLCTNAVYAMKEKGGALKVAATRFEVQRRVPENVSELSPGRYVRIIVSDTGKGMSRDIISRIYDPYFTTKKRGEGTGMGLAIAHQIVTELGGGIAVQSELQKGSSFEVFLPEIRGEKKPGGDVHPALPTGTGKILLIDDEEICVTSLQAALERLGYTVVAKLNSVDALNTFREEPNRFDLIITDQAMPGLAGVELSEEVMKMRPGMPIVLVTGFSEVVDKEKARRKGIREFMLKPFSVQDIAETVRRACSPR